MPPELTTTTAQPAAPASEELAFLSNAGEDIADLRSELESMLARREPSQDAPPPVEPRPLTGQDRIPIREDGTIIEPQKAGDKPVTEPLKADPATDKPTTQEQALDPYAPDGTKAKAEDIATPEIEPGELVLDAEGKMRDAKTGRYVPHAAMQQERLRRKELEVELAKKDEAFARASERLNVLQEIMHSQEQLATKQKTEEKLVEPEAEIDPEVDIFGWAKQQKERGDRAEKRLAEIAERNDKQVGELATQQRYRQDITAFAAQNKDFFDSYKFVSGMRVRELQAMGFPEANIAAQVAAEERALVTNALAKGGSPAQVLYNLAKAKGFVSTPEPAAAVSATAPAAAAPTVNSGQQVLIPQPDAKAVEQVQRIQNGVAASATLSGAGGTGGEGLTVQQLAEMPDDQFDALVLKIGRKNFDRLLGGR